jgi:hypothetical protein
MAAVAFSTRVTEALAGATTTGSVKADSISAFGTFNTAMQAIFTTYDLNAKEKLWFDNALIDLARDLEAKLR